MNALAKIFGSDPAPGIRTSARIREELAALPQPQRHSELLQEASQRRAELANLTGPELKDAEREVADLEVSAATYRSKHDRVFVQSAALIDELVDVQRRERLALIASRLQFHEGPETEDCARRIREANAATSELLAQRIATHLLAKSWGIDIPWTFGFPPLATERRAKEIVAELQSK
jgi:hypothetical protein